MQHLYAPWRTEYIMQKVEGCVFCNIASSPELDDEHQVLFRNEDLFVVINKYPYTPGHFMVIPILHTDKVEALPAEVWMAMSIKVQESVRLLKEGFGADGVNIGMNLGQSAGAGIAEHVHYHLVPRFSRDTNFITTIADVRVYPTDFARIYHKLLELAPKYFS
jgi:ATP adenylyltransferase